MDVTCERCSTEYEFDETLVSERGTTVKCTNCGHLFKVYRNEGEGERPWILKRADGSEQTLASLRELQQAITQGHVDENDRISRSGEAWKRLGDIAELRTFFQAAMAARPSPSTSADGRKQTLFGVGAAPPTAKVSAPPPAKVSAPPPPMSAPPPAPSKPEPPRSAPPRSAPPRSAPPRSAPPRSAPPKPTPPKPAAPSRPAPPKPRPPTPAAPSTPPTPPANVAPKIDGNAATQVAPQRPPKLSDAPPARAAERAPRLDDPSPKAGRPAASASLYIDDEEEAVIPGSGGGRPFLWVAIILLAAAGVTAVVLWDQVGPLLGITAENPGAAFLEEGDAAFELGTVDGYDDAIRAYTRASAIAPEEPAVFAAIARAEVYWAQTLAFQASDIEARLAATQAALNENAENEEDPAAVVAATNDPALVGEAARIRAEIRRHAERGQENAEIALGLSDGHGAAEVAFASASRLLGDDEAAQTHMDRAQERLPERTPDFHLTRALLAATTGSMSDAVAGASAAVDADGSFVLARLTLARAHLAAGNLEGAREQARAVLSSYPEHTDAMALESAMDRGVPPAAPVVEVPSVDQPENDVTPEPIVDAPEPQPATPDPEGSPTRNGSRSSMRASETSEGPPPERREYSWYIRQGDALMDAGNIGRAREYYQAAVETRPGSPEALTGLGYVELERRRYDSAVRYFRQAKNNNYGDAYIGLGEALRRMGRREQAAGVYEEYLASRPNGPQANVARRQIEALQPSGGDTPTPTMDPDTQDETIDETDDPGSVTPSEEAPAQAPTESPEQSAEGAI